MEIKYGHPIGGQALPNGVMMRSGNKISLALRLRSGNIVTGSWVSKHKQTAQKRPPILRGIQQLAASLKASAQTIRMAYRLLKQANQPRVTLNLMLHIVAVVLVFFSYAVASELLYGFLMSILSESSLYYLFSVVYGASDLVLLLLSLFFILLLPSIRKLIKYHGAEHKAITCYEKGLDLTIENVRTQSRFHRRCGTSMVAVIVLAVVAVSMFLPPQLTEAEQSLILCVVMLIAAGLSYEAMRSKRVPLIFKLGLAAQRITTKEPSDDMIECAIAAIIETIKY